MQGRTVAGLLDLVPAIVTLLVVLFLVEKTDALVRPLPFIANRPWDFPGLGLIVIIVLFYIIGLIISTRFGLKLSEWKNSLIGCIPVIRNIFGVTQQVMTSFTSQYTLQPRRIPGMAQRGNGSDGLRNGQSLLIKNQ